MASWRPSHAYVPGQTPRHADTAFETFKTDLPDTPIKELPDSRAWEYGIAFLADGYFWKAHELFEAIWMACPPNSAEAVAVRGIIQFANAGLKEKMGQIRAQNRLIEMAQSLMAEAERRDVDPRFVLSKSMQSRVLNSARYCNY